MKWRLKSYPHCGGDIMIYDDCDGWHETCLQCGYQVELENEDILDYVPSKNSSDNPEIMEYETVESGLTRKD